MRKNIGFVIALVLLTSCGGEKSTPKSDTSETPVEVTKNLLFSLDCQDGTNCNRYSLFQYDPDEETITEILGDYTEVGDINFHIHKQKVYFQASSVNEGYEAWVYDPFTPISSGVNPKILKDLAIGSTSSYASYFTSSGDILYFKAFTGSDYMLLKYDTTQEVSSSNPVEIDVRVESILGVFDNKLYFASDQSSSTQGSELWVYDENAPISVGVNPSIVFDLAPGTSGSFPGDLTMLQGKIYYSATIASGVGREIFVYDPSQIASASNPIVLTDLKNPGSSFATSIATESKLLITGDSDSYGRELFIYDPAENLSSSNPEVVDYVSGTTGHEVSNLAYINQIVYYNAESSVGSSFWSFDPTLPIQALFNPKEYTSN